MLLGLSLREETRQFLASHISKSRLPLHPFRPSRDKDKVTLRPKVLYIYVPEAIPPCHSTTGDWLISSHKAEDRDNEMNPVSDMTKERRPFSAARIPLFFDQNDSDNTIRSLV
jgi:hypothetical protein